MLLHNAYDRYCKPLKVAIFSGNKVKPRAIRRDLLGIDDKTTPIMQFFLTSTNVVKNTEEIWGKFYCIPTKKEDAFIVLFEYLLKKNDSTFTGVAEVSEDEDGDAIVIRSLTDKNVTLQITSLDHEKYPGLIITSRDTKGSKKISKLHWKILQEKLGKINVSI